MNLDTREVLREGAVALLTPNETALLRHLAERPDRVVSRDELLAAVWDWKAARSSRAADSTVMRVRRKIERDPDHPEALLTIHGHGYRLALHEVLPDWIVGRGDDLRALRAALADAPVVVVHGPGGVGKTTLARALPPRGARTLDLLAGADPDVLLADLCRLLGVPTEGAAVAGRVAARLRSERTLLRVDGADVDVDGVVAACAALLPEDGPSRAVVTSRSRSARAANVALRPLAPPDAAALYRARARAAGGPEAAARDVEVLVARVDHLPLGIELAAARARTFTPAEITRRLERDGLADPTGTRGTEELVGWSWALLDPAQRAALAALSVLGAPFDLELAERLGAGDAVERLAAASLLTGEPGALRVYDLVRSYVLRSGGALVPAARAARDAVVVAEAAASGDVPPPDAFVVRHRAVLVATLGDPDADPAAVAAAAGALTARPSLPSVRAAALERGVVAAGIARDRGSEILLRARRASLRRQAADLAGAEADLAAAEALAEADPRWRATAAHARARHLHQTGAVDRAEPLLREVLAARRAQGDAVGEARALADLGAVLGRSGRRDEARDVLVAAVGRLRGNADRRDLGTALLNLAALGGPPADVRALYDDAVDVFREIADPRSEAIARSGRANTWTRADDPDRAVAEHGEALALHASAGNRQGEAYALANRSAAHEVAGRLTSAEVDLVAALDRARAVGDRTLLAFVLVRLAGVDIARDRPAAAVARLDEAAGLAGPALRTSLACARAWAWAALGRTADAAAALAGLPPDPTVALATAALAPSWAEAVARVRGLTGLDPDALVADDPTLRPTVQLLRRRFAG